MTSRHLTADIVRASFGYKFDWNRWGSWPAMPAGARRSKAPD
jgi:hypothetical protein